MSRSPQPHAASESRVRDPSPHPCSSAARAAAWRRSPAPRTPAAGDETGRRTPWRGCADRPAPSRPASECPCPSTSTCPLDGLSSPPRICSSVVFARTRTRRRSRAARPRGSRGSRTCRTSRVTGPCWNCLATSRASRTDSVMSQSLGRRGSRRTPSGVDGSERAQKERHDADAYHVRRSPRRRAAHSCNRHWRP